MILKDLLRDEICRNRMTPNYPLGDFDRWVKGSGVTQVQLLCSLSELKRELEEEMQMLQHHNGRAEANEILQYQYWCFYCDQIRTHYRTLIKHPEMADYLAVIRHSDWSLK